MSDGGIDGLEGVVTEEKALALFVVALIICGVAAGIDKYKHPEKYKDFPKSPAEKIIEAKENPQLAEPKVQGRG